MTVRIGFIGVGDEVLAGMFTDANAADVAEQFEQGGVDATIVESRYITDDADSIERAIRELAPTVDLVITSGGMGYTHNDGTRFAAARLTDDKMQLDLGTYRRIKSTVDRHGSFVDANAVGMLALHPLGTRVIDRGDSTGLPVMVIDGVPAALGAGFPPVFHDEMKSLAAEISAVGLADIVDRAPSASWQERTPAVAETYDPLPKAQKRGPSVAGLAVVVPGEPGAMRSDLAAISKSLVGYGADLTEVRIVPVEATEAHRAQLEGREDVAHASVVNHLDERGHWMEYSEDSWQLHFESLALRATTHVHRIVVPTTLDETQLNELLPQLRDQRSAVRVQLFQDMRGTDGAVTALLFTGRSEADVRAALAFAMDNDAFATAAGAPTGFGGLYPKVYAPTKPTRDDMWMYPAVKPVDPLGKEIVATMRALEAFDGALTPLEFMNPTPTNRALIESFGLEISTPEELAHRALRLVDTLFDARARGFRMGDGAWGEALFHSEYSGALNGKTELIAGMLLRRIGHLDAAITHLSHAEGEFRDEPVAFAIATREIDAAHAALARRINDDRLIPARDAENVDDIARTHPRVIAATRLAHNLRFLDVEPKAGERYADTSPTDVGVPALVARAAAQPSTDHAIEAAKIGDPLLAERLTAITRTREAAGRSVTRRGPLRS